MSDERTYTDSDGNTCTLDVLCRREPAWAASRLRFDRERLRRLVAAVRAYEDGHRSSCVYGPCGQCLHCAMVAELEACEAGE